MNKYIKKIHLLLLFTLFLYSCSQQDNYSGIWLDKDSERDKIEITKGDNNYFITLGNKKIPAKLEEGTLNINGKLMAIDEEGNLLFNGESFVKLENSITNKFIGSWKGCDVIYRTNSPEKGDCTIYCTIKFKENNLILTNLCNRKTYKLKLTNEGIMQTKLDYNYGNSNKLNLKIKENGELFWQDPMGSKIFNKVENIEKIIDNLVNKWTDERDGEKYNVVKIGNQIWMADNYKFKASKGYSTEREVRINGGTLDKEKVSGFWYTQESALNNCPKGWHLPSKEEWEILLNEIKCNIKKERLMTGKDFNTYYGNLFRLINSENWDNLESKNEFGLSINPSYKDFGKQTVKFVTSSNDIYGHPYYFRIRNENYSIDGEPITGFGQFYEGRKNLYYSVRYIRDLCE